MKSAMANKLLATPRPEQHAVGGNVPVVLSDDESVELVDLVDEDSWLAFNILKLEGKWLSDDPANWCNSEEHRVMCGFVSSLRVTNDTAERCSWSNSLPIHSPGWRRICSGCCRV